MTLRDRLDGPQASMVALLFAITVAGLLLVNAILGFTWALESRTMRARAEAVAGQAAAALDAHARLMQARANDLSTSPDVRRVLDDGSDTALKALQEELARTFPGLHSVQLVALGTLGIAAPGFNPASLHNNIEINLASDTFNARNPRAEAIAEGEHWLVVVAARIAVPDAGGNGGVLLLRARFDAALKDFLLPAQPQGEYSFRSVGADGAQRAVAVAGAAADAETEVFLAATTLQGIQAAFRPGAGFIDDASVSGITLVTAGLTGTGLLLGLVLVGFRQMRQQLQEDATRLQELALYQRVATASVPRLNYTVLGGLGEALVQLRRDIHAAGRRSQEERDAGIAAREAQRDSLEIEVIEEIPSSGGEIGFEAEPELVVPAEIFRDYDIRGRSEQITPQLAYAIGQAIGTEALERENGSIVVGADGRHSSPVLREHLVRGLIAAGMDVIDAGTVATPMLYFACHHLRTLTGVMVTGSHNPAEHNGFKIMIGGETLCGERISALRERILGERFNEGQGTYRVTEIDADYMRAVCDDVLVDKPLKVVVDCGNGAASVIATELLQELGCEVFPLFCELDGSFPNHAPDPSVPGNLRQLLAEVAARGADIGVAFDGDGDRIGVVSATGRILTADRLLMLFARDMLSRHPGADIVFDVKCSRDLAVLVSEHGGSPVMCRSGHSWIKEKMKETGALLGGEFTGHICFKDRWFGFDDALYAAARLLEVISSEDRSLDELLATLPVSVGTPEIRIELSEDRKFALMEQVSTGFALEGARLIKIDGVRAEFSDGWGLVRASNTSAALICRFEARNERALDRIQTAFLAELKRLAPELPVTD